MNCGQVQFDSERKTPLYVLHSGSVLICHLAQNSQIFYLSSIKVKDYRWIEKPTSFLKGLSLLPTF